MNFLLEFLPEVNQDVQEAYDWYEAQAVGLGENFLLAVDAAIDTMVRHPLIYSKEYKNVRKSNVKRFPFGIFYTIGTKTITVIAITHLSRHPNTWKRRKSKR